MIPERNSDLSSLKRYTRARQTAASEIRALENFLAKRRGDAEAGECRELLVKLAEDRFVLSVVGQFKRGKSSLMNAVVGRNILPTGVLPLTSVVTALKYGPAEKLTLLRNGSARPEEVPVSEIAEFVTERGNPGNAKGIARACLELPAPFLRRGLEFIDTPGIGSAIAANAATTRAFLPQSDAVIFVTSVDTPMSGAENDFLQSIREHVRKIFFVLNKIDLASDSERIEITAYIFRTLSRQFEAAGPQIFPVSSRDALDAIAVGDEAKFDRSGLKSLQETLSDFLARERGAVFLASVLDKALALTGREVGRMRLLKSAGEVSETERGKKASALATRFQDLRKARAQLLAEAGKRIATRTREIVSAKAKKFVCAETAAINQTLNEVLSKSRWKPSFIAARAFSRQALPRLSSNLDDWTKSLGAALNDELRTMLGAEWTGLERELRRIPAAADEILGNSQAPPFRDNPDGGRPAVDITIEPAAAPNAPRPMISPLVALLPVFITGLAVRKRLAHWIHHLVSASARSAGDRFSGEIRRVIDAMGLEIEKRAAEIESGIMRALQGERLQKGIDGQWRVVDLDRKELSAEIEVLEGIEERLRSIRTLILESNPDPENPPEIVPAPEAPLPVPETADGTAEGFDFVRDLNTRGCPICNRMIEAASRFFAGRQYALSAYEPARRAFAVSLGFCPLHMWQLEAMASPKGLSTGLSNLMERLSNDLGRLAESLTENPEKSIGALVQNPARCPVCRLVRDATVQYVHSLAAFLRTGDGRAAYDRSRGVCLRHLQMLAAEIGPGGLFRFLIAHAARRFLETAEDMRNFAIKGDALRTDLQNRDERDAYLRAIVHTAGAKGVCFPWEPGEI